MITLKLLAVLKEYAPNDGCLEIEYSTGMTVADALAATGIDKTNHRYSTLVNGKRKSADETLADGDSITVMPLLAGG